MQWLKSTIIKLQQCLLCFWSNWRPSHGCTWHHIKNDVMPFEDRPRRRNDMKLFKLSAFHCGTAACWHQGQIMGHFTRLNLTSVAAFSPAQSNNKSSLTCQAELYWVKGASSSHKVVTSGPFFLQGRALCRQQRRLTSSPGNGRPLFGRPVMLLNNLRVEENVFKVDPEATGREEAWSNLRRDKTEQTE